MTTVSTKPAKAAQSSIDAKLEKLAVDFIEACRKVDPTILQAMRYSDETMGRRRPIAGVHFGRAHAPLFHKRAVKP